MKKSKNELAILRYSPLNKIDSKEYPTNISAKRAKLDCCFRKGIIRVQIIQPFWRVIWKNLKNEVICRLRVSISTTRHDVHQMYKDVSFQHGSYNGIRVISSFHWKQKKTLCDHKKDTKTSGNECNRKTWLNRTSQTFIGEKASCRHWINIFSKA